MLVLDLGDGTNALITETFEGDGVSDSVTLANEPASINNTQVYISGVYQLKNTYSLSGKVITFTEIPPDGRSIEVVIASLVTYDSVVIPDVIDEDDMISDSDQHVPTQQSVKAYVDNSATGGSLFKGNNGIVGDPSGIDDIFRVNAQTLNTNVTIDTDQNASAAGPLAIADTVVLTVSGNLNGGIMSTLQVQTLQGPTSGADSNTIRVADNHKLYAKGHVVQVQTYHVGDLAGHIETTSMLFKIVVQK